MTEPQLATPASTSDEVQVVVVGAGLSGLVAARELHRRGMDVVVLEATDRVGGRAMSETSALGSRLDVGGQWIGHDHDRVKELAAELELRSYPMHTGKVPTVLDDGRTLRIASPSTVVAAAVLVVAGALARFGTPRRWDTLSVQDALAMVPGSRARRLLEAIASVSWTADLDRLSVAAAAELIRHQGGLKTMLATRGGAQDTLLVEGAGTIVERLAAELGPACGSASESSRCTATRPA